MKKNARVEALIMEKDRFVAESISNTLREHAYEVTFSDERAEAVSLIRKQPMGLVFLGETRDTDTIFNALKEIVMASPMTSVILITDLPDGEVEDMAEGYGILGHIGRDAPREGLVPLLETHEKISGLLPST